MEKDWTSPSLEWKNVGNSFHKSVSTSYPCQLPYVWKTIPIDNILLQIFIDTPKDIAHERLVKRHLEAGICASKEEAEARAGGSDARNGEDILRWRGKVDILIKGDDFSLQEYLKEEANIAT